MIENSDRTKYKSVDLFAGCGGLSLGLEQAGFTTVYVNELHPDAMETFITNRPNHGLENPMNHSNDIAEVTGNKENLKDLRTHLTKNGEIDLVCGGPPCQGFSGIGLRKNIQHRKRAKRSNPSNKLYKNMAAFIEAVSPRAFIFENVKRLETARWGHSDHFKAGGIWEDIRKTFKQIRAVPPDSIDAYRYIIQWDILQAKDFRVPQNRPRLIMVGIRQDIYERIGSAKQQKQQLLRVDDVPEGAPFLLPPNSRIQVILENQRQGKPKDRSYGGLEDEQFFPEIAFREDYSEYELRRMKTGTLDKILNFWGDTEHSWRAPDPVRVIGDLVDEGYRSGSTTIYPSSKEGLSEIQRYFRERNGKKGQPITEQDYSSHKTETIKIFEKIQRDGAIMQAKTEEIKKVDEKAKAYFFDHVVGDFEGVLSEEEINEISEGISADQEENWPYIATLQAIANAAKEKINETNEEHIKNLIKKVQTVIYYRKKFAQRLLPEEWPEEPNVTITSAPDDLIHFSQPRILTVREWARMQTFPDWYQFRGHRTSGGDRRSGRPWEGKYERDLPKYTQIGNAVPVKMAEAIGDHIAILLQKADELQKLQ